MTTSTAPLPTESLPTGATSSPKSNPTGRIYTFEFSAPRPIPLVGSVSVETLVKEAEADTNKAAHMQQARQRLAATLYADEPETLSALRLAAGYSQAQLADKAATSQPHIARIERGQTDPGTDTIARIATALGVDEMRVFRAIRKQLGTRSDAA